jgi:signal transduction histidine kinase
MAAQMAVDVDQAFDRAITQSLLLAGAGALVVAVGLSVVMSRYVAVPIGRLARATGQVAGGSYGERLGVEGPRELAALASGFNEMAGALQRAEAQRRALVGDIAHELRTPLATLDGYVEGLIDGVIPPSAETWAVLQGEARRLGRIVADLQEVSRTEAGQLRLSLQPLDPAAAVRTAAGRLGPEFAAKGITLSVEAAPGLPPVEADPDRLQQVLANLLSNALRHTPPGGTVGAHVTQQGAMIRFSVVDSGSGIAAEDLPRVFERFFRADPSRARASGGSGVGLTIAKALVEQMGGSIEAASAGPGQGATFTFELPVAGRPLPQS